jgi:hypothetical protein
VARRGESQGGDIVKKEEKQSIFCQQCREGKKKKKKTSKMPF